MSMLWPVLLLYTYDRDFPRSQHHFQLSFGEPSPTVCYLHSLNDVCVF